MPDRLNGTADESLPGYDLSRKDLVENIWNLVKVRLLSPERVKMGLAANFSAQQEYEEERRNYQEVVVQLKKAILNTIPEDIESLSDHAVDLMIAFGNEARYERQTGFESPGKSWFLIPNKVREVWEENQKPKSFRELQCKYQEELEWVELDEGAPTEPTD